MDSLTCTLRDPAPRNPSRDRQRATNNPSRPPQADEGAVWGCGPPRPFNGGIGDERLHSFP